MPPDQPTENGLPFFTDVEVQRYARQLLLPGVGLEGQRKLKAARVLVIGMGGLGSPIALYLAAAGVGKLGLVDHDLVSLGNLQRQILHSTSTVGQWKVDSAARRLSDLNPGIEVVTYREPFTSGNAMEIASEYDILVDGTDNFPTRYLANDVAVLVGKPFVYGSIARFDGQVSVFDARVGPCYRCLFPEPPPPGMVTACAEEGVFGVLPGMIGTLQATEVLKLILGIGQPLIGRLLLYNALDLTFDFIHVARDPDCAICSGHPTIPGLAGWPARIDPYGF